MVYIRYGVANIGMMPSVPQSPRPTDGAQSPESPEKPRGPRAFNVPPVTLAVAAVLVAVFGVLTLAPVPWTVGIVETFSLRPIRVALALAHPADGRPVLAALSFLTHALIHIDGVHIAFNVGFLLAFGSMCERAFGPRRYIAILVLTAIAGAAAKLAVDWAAPVIMFGASGAVFGCMGAFVRLLISGPAHIRKRGLVLMGALVVVNIILTFVGPAIFGIDGRIAWDAHLGGFVAGLLLGWPPRRKSLRAAG